jgi:hypothetical protein
MTRKKCNFDPKLAEHHRAVQHTKYHPESADCADRLRSSLPILLLSSGKMIEINLLKKRNPDSDDILKDLLSRMN